MKDPFSTKLGKAEAQWVERQAIVFGSYSLVIETCVRVVIALITRGTLRFELAELQELLQRNEGNERLPLAHSKCDSAVELINFVPAVPPKTLLRADRAERSAPGRANGSLRRICLLSARTLEACQRRKATTRLPVSKVAKEAWFTTPFQFRRSFACEGIVA